MVTTTRWRILWAVMILHHILASKHKPLLQLLLLYVLLWSVSMGVVITVANVEVQIPPPVLHLCCFTNSVTALDVTFCILQRLTLHFKRGFFSRLCLFYVEKETSVEG